MIDEAPLPRRRLQSSAGFTLFEMLIVLAIVALTLTFSALAIRGKQGPAALLPVAARVAADLKLARSEAMLRNHAVEVVFDPRTRGYRVEGTRAGMLLPADIGFAFATAGDLVRDEHAGHLVFYPDGSSTGGRLTLSDRRRAVTLAIDWLTGSVRQSGAAR